MHPDKDLYVFLLDEPHLQLKHPIALLRDRRYGRIGSLNAIPRDMSDQTTLQQLFVKDSRSTNKFKIGKSGIPWSAFTKPNRDAILSQWFMSEVNPDLEDRFCLPNEAATLNASAFAAAMLEGQAVLNVDDLLFDFSAFGAAHQIFGVAYQTGIYARLTDKLLETIFPNGKLIHRSPRQYLHRDRLQSLTNCATWMAPQPDGRTPAQAWSNIQQYAQQRGINVTHLVTPETLKKILANNL